MTLATARRPCSRSTGRTTALGPSTTVDDGARVLHVVERPKRTNLLSASRTTDFQRKRLRKAVSTKTATGGPSRAGRKPPGGSPCRVRSGSTGHWELESALSAPGRHSRWRVSGWRARAASRAPDPSPDLVADRSVSAVARPGNGYRPADSPLRDHWAAPHPAPPPGPGEVLGQMTGHPAEVSLGTSTGAQASHLVISNTTVGPKWFERL